MRALDALPEDQGLSLSTHMSAHCFPGEMKPSWLPLQEHCITWLVPRQEQTKHPYIIIFRN